MARRRRGSTRKEGILSRQKRLRDESYARLKEEEFRRKAERQAERSASRTRFIPEPPGTQGVINPLAAGWRDEFNESGIIDPRWRLKGKFVTESAETQQMQQEMQAKAEFDAGQSELKYTQKQKREMDRLRMVPQLAKQSGIFNEDQLDQINQKVMLDILGYTPTEQFKLTQFPKGQGFGESWEKPDGTTVSRDEKGNEKLMQRFDQGREAQSMKEEQDSVKAQAKLQADIDKEKRAFERDLYTKDVTEGLRKRSRTPEEVRQILRGYGRSNEINKAKDLISEVRSKFGNIDEIPEDIRQQFFDAVDLIEDTEAKKDIPTVSNDADYEKLPSGTRFIDPNGKERVKP